MITAVGKRLLRLTCSCIGTTSLVCLFPARPTTPEPAEVEANLLAVPVFVLAPRLRPGMEEDGPPAVARRLEDEAVRVRFNPGLLVVIEVVLVDAEVEVEALRGLRPARVDVDEAGRVEVEVEAESGRRVVVPVLVTVAVVAAREVGTNPVELPGRVVPVMTLLLLTSVDDGPERTGCLTPGVVVVVCFSWDRSCVP